MAIAHSAEIAGEIDQARDIVHRLRRELNDAEHHLHSLEALLAMTGPTEERDEVGPSTMTLHQAMATVLSDAPNQMMRAGDLTAEINRRGLYRMRDGRPAEAQQIHARVGHYPQQFKRKGTFICLVK